MTLKERADKINHSPMVVFLGRLTALVAVLGTLGQAVNTSLGVSDLQKRFDVIEERQGKLETGFNSYTSKLSLVDYRLQRVEAWKEAREARIDSAATIYLEMLKSWCKAPSQKDVEACASYR